ncbi:hypothetical protein C8A05DRAFT_16916 [Staphylotrichum tortipilum]|uniref:Rhodopsin domain-containing protein n=1 Tax=Staphylotrichum tortipilum TaxID=2831512 RepID=A0AAN6MIN1_9PEZI|nr:hypothetical protein C8A05DRAFT_16916 [Staphylotrichum longicolle]
MELLALRAEVGASQGGPVDMTDYCMRRRAGLETGPVSNIGPKGSAIIWSLVGGATAFLLLRIYCKIWRSRGIWWDDVTMFVAESIMCQRAIDYGFGKYACDIPPANLARIALEGGGIGSALTILAIMWSKTSFGITLFRLAHNWLRWLVLGVLVIMNVCMMLQAIFFWVKCDPVEKNWHPAIPGRCWDLRVSNGYALFNAVLSGVCDVLFALLPWRLLWGLEMRTKEKIGLVVAMSMGVSAGGTAFMKANQLQTMGTKNFTHDGIYLITWAAAEIATTIIASCIPMLRVLFRDLRSTSLTEISGTGGQRYDKYQKSSRATATTTGVANGDVEASAADPAPSNNNNNQQDAPIEDAASQETETAKKTPWWKPWGSFWDGGMGSRVPRALRRKSVSAHAARQPFALTENSSQRMLVQTPAGESTSVGQGGERGIVQTQEFELTYAERRPERESLSGYELERVGVGEAR